MKWNFDNSYSLLPPQLFQEALPIPVTKPSTVVFNYDLAEELNLINNKNISLNEIAETLSGNKIPDGAHPIALAYAGHQFGHFTMLGDGRAILLGEHICTNGTRKDIQLKGAGTTNYSRRGDGRATLSAMLREYLISEAMHHLGIPTTRSLAVTASGEEVYREQAYPGAILTRVAASHIRVGTFEYISNFHSTELLKQFTHYTVNRHFPELLQTENVALALLEKVMKLQISLIIQWMRVGFIHGVMNTDNMSISGETIDYGPCAFMNAYYPKTVFSSIDHQGRYAFYNQPGIALWNISCLAEALLPLIDHDNKTAIKKAQNMLDGFKAIFEKEWLNMMRKKLGITNEHPDDIILVSELLNWMEENKVDYTNTFIHLARPEAFMGDIYLQETFKTWLNKWQQRIGSNSLSHEASMNLMMNNNPAYIPRNHLVERALNEAGEHGNMAFFNELYSVLKHPYDYQQMNKTFQEPPATNDRYYKTYCGT